MFGGTAIAADTFDHYPDFQRRRQWFIEHRPDLVASIQPAITPGANKMLLLGFVREDQLRSLLSYMLDENEFLSPFGVRAVSRHHLAHPLVLHLAGQEYRLDYEPGESTTLLFGGNSNWRGPVWMPVNQLILDRAPPISSLLRRHVQNRMSNRLGPTQDTCRGRSRASSTPGPYFSAGSERQSRSLWLQQALQ